MSAQPLVNLIDVSKRYGDAQALHSTSLSIERGRTTVLIGPSGCGKSTVMRLIIGLIESDTGKIEFDGTPITPNNVDNVRHRIGYVIQEGGLFPHLDARANASLMARHLGTDNAQMERRLLEFPEPTTLSEKIFTR